MKKRTSSSTSKENDALDDVIDSFGEIDDHADYEGTSIDVTWGKEHTQPVQYQGLDIGPFSMTVVVHKGETPLRAKRRAMQHLNLMAEEEYQLKLPKFIERCKGTKRT